MVKYQRIQKRSNFAIEKYGDFMKNLKDIIKINEEANALLYSSTGTFFAFSDDDYKNKCEDGVIYKSLAMGMYVPAENVEKVVNGIVENRALFVKSDLDLHTVDEIIERELRNYECFYSFDYSDCIEPLADYGVTESEIRKVFLKLSKRM